MGVYHNFTLNPTWEYYNFSHHYAKQNVVELFIQGQVFFKFGLNKSKGSFNLWWRFTPSQQQHIFLAILSLKF